MKKHFLLFLFFIFVTMGVGYSSIYMNGKVSDRVARLDGEDIPLLLAVLEASRHQLEQVMRVNETLMFGEVGDRGKFELANEGFANSGRRLNTVIVEARHIAQKGLENAQSDSEKLVLEQVKTVISDFQKIHADFEHIAGNIIRESYKYRFLIKAGIATGNSNTSLAEAEKEYLKSLSKSISALDDETKRLEGKLKQASEVVKGLSHNVGKTTNRYQYLSWIAFIIGITVMTGVGTVLLLMFNAEHMNKTKTTVTGLQGKAQNINKKAGLVLSSTRQITGLFQKLLDSNSKYKAELQGTVASTNLLQEDLTDSQKAAQSFEDFVKGTAVKAQRTGIALTALKDISARSEEACKQIQKTLQSMNSTVMNINMLATSASAENSKNSVFTSEIKNAGTELNQMVNAVLSALETLSAGARTASETSSTASEKLQEISTASDLLAGSATVSKEAVRRYLTQLIGVQSNLLALRTLMDTDLMLVNQSHQYNMDLEHNVVEIDKSLKDILALIEGRYEMDMTPVNAEEDDDKNISGEADA